MPNKTEWFSEPGAYVLVDGQYGSTGKGLLAGFLAEEYGIGRITHVTTNAGPNSGHTAYIGPGLPPTEVITRQIPIASVVLARMAHGGICHLNAGALLDISIVREEAEKWGVRPAIDPTAAIILPEYKNSPSLQKIASTGKGTGAALAAKIMREGMVARDVPRVNWGPNPFVMPKRLVWDWNNHVVFVETAQGFNLGLNDDFYPYGTARECTVMQALADARIPHTAVKRAIGCFRTHPIRVGNIAEGQSGGCYPDQREIEWADIGIAPEITTVTKRQRRLFTWSRKQFKESVVTNGLDSIFLNFINYIADMADQSAFIDQAIDDYTEAMGRRPTQVLLGHSKYAHSIVEVPV